MGEFAQPSLVKICGITTLHDALVARDAGADAIGLIFAPSRRRVSVDTAQEISRGVGASLVRVGVFRDDVADLARVLDEVALEAVQYHGEEPPGLVAEVRSRGLAYIRALPASTARASAPDAASADALLVDGPQPGSGRTHSWHGVTSRDVATPLIVAGGLTPRNVDAALRATGAWGCDVASGVESGPGRKDPIAVRDFVAAARRHFRERGDS